jgi:hypothetical protein
MENRTTVNIKIKRKYSDASRCVLIRLQNSQNLCKNIAPLQGSLGEIDKISLEIHVQCQDTEK